MNIMSLVKFLIALVGALAFVLVISFITTAIYTPIKDKGTGYNFPIPEVAVVKEQPAPTQTSDATTEQDATPAEPAEPVETASLATLLASASVENGKKVARKCIACHNMKPENKNMVGPGLWGIIGHKVGTHVDFKYSKIFQELSANGLVWDYENLNEFLTSPKTFAPKSKMTFAGIKKDQDRADLLAYLQTLSDEPVAFPTE